ncbi:MAG: hypothetical protein ACPIOQ_78895 [Promethearchaeia archaeon]
MQEKLALATRATKQTSVPSDTTPDKLKMQPNGSAPLETHGPPPCRTRSPIEIVVVELSRKIDKALDGSTIDMGIRAKTENSQGAPGQQRTLVRASGHGELMLATNSGHSRSQLFP